MTEIVIAVVLVALLGAGCLTMKPKPPEPPLQGFVSRAFVEPPYMGGEPTYCLTIEFRDEHGALSVRTMPATPREWRRWGREGAEVCLRPQSDGSYQMVGCD